ncbi:MAG: alpha/beta fold hydrolase [Planctomycetota bacterium]
MRTLLVVLLLASAAAAAGTDRTGEVADLYRRLEGSGNPGAVAEAERHLLGTGKDRAFHAARAAWEVLAATKGGETASEDDRRRARRIYDLACGACAASVDWTREVWKVAGLEVRLVRSGFLTQPLGDVVPAGLQPTKHFGRLVTTDGIGGAVVVVFPETEARRKAWPYLPPVDFAYAVTALLRFDGEAPRFELLDPLERPTAGLFGGTHPLRANFTAPFAAMAPEIGDVAEEGLNTPRLDLEALYVLEPPRDDKIPVLFVHGLKSSPRAWRKMALALRADETIRRNFQFVAYQYPTGYALPLLNARLRKVMAEFWTWFDGRAPQARERGYVAIGHSMGGLQIRSLGVSSGSEVWDLLFSKPAGQVYLTGSLGDLVRRIAIFTPDPKLARLVFLATPHRGSPLATGAVGAIGSGMVHEDPIVRDLRAEILKRYGALLRPEVRRRLGEPRNSIDNLDPESEYLKALAGLPFRPGLPFHSIVGDMRGDRENPTGDGVVPYASAHLDGAASELIVKSGHSVQETAEAIAEVKRILELHLAGAGEKK